MILPLASLPLSSRHRVSQISFHKIQPYLAVQSHDRSVEIFRIRSEEEVRKKQARRRKREEEKRKKGGNEPSEAVPDEEANLEPKNLELVDLFTPHLVVRASGKIRSFDFSQSDAGKGNLSVRQNHLSSAFAAQLYLRFFLH
jgi:U3 small nucleolar RNA-associated protein 12